MMNLLIWQNHSGNPAILRLNKQRKRLSADSRFGKREEPAVSAKTVGYYEKNFLEERIFRILYSLNYRKQL